MDASSCCALPESATWTDYTGLDPEVSRGGDDSRRRGYDYNVYPNYRTYTFGMTATF